MSIDELRTILKLPASAETTKSFEDLGVDSWALIELRASLEAKLSRTIPDEDWLSVSCPNDVLRLCQ